MRRPLMLAALLLPLLPAHALQLHIQAEDIEQASWRTDLLIIGARARIAVTGATPGDRVYFGASETLGAGPCFGPACAGIDPVTLLGSAVANGQGHALIQLMLPDDGSLAPGPQLLQALQVGAAPSASEVLEVPLLWIYADTVPYTVGNAQLQAFPYLLRARSTVPGTALAVAPGPTGSLEATWLEEVVGTLDLRGTTADTFRAPRLERVDGSLYTAEGRAFTLDLPAATEITSTLMLGGTAGGVSAQLPLLETLGYLSATQGGSSLDAPTLHTATGALNWLVSGPGPLLLPALQSARHISVGNTGLLSLSLPSLVSVGGGFTLENNQQLGALDLGSLQIVDGQLRVDRSGLAALYLPELREVARTTGGLWITGNDLLSTLDLPLLEAVGLFAPTVANNPLLPACHIEQVFGAWLGWKLNCTGNAVDECTDTVNSGGSAAHECRS